MKPKSTLRPFLALAGSALLAVSSTQAQLYWDSNGTTGGFGTANGTWGTSNFWNDNATGGAGTFTTATTSGSDVNFGTASAGYTGGRTVTISGTQTFNSMTIGSASGAITFSGGTALDLGNANTVITQNSTSATTISTVFGGGTNGLTKEGSGRLILTGGNTYTGNTVVNAGVLRFGSTWNNSWGTGTRSLNVDSNLEINNGIVEAYYFTNRALGTASGEIQLTGGRAGFTNLQADNSGNPFVTFGTVGTTVTWGSAAFKPTTFVMNDVGAAGVMRMANPFDLDGAQRTIEVAATGAGGSANNGRGTYGTMEGVLSGTGTNSSLRKIGTGTLMLNGTNTYVGGTTIDAGGVWFDKKLSMPASGTVTVNDGGILSVSVGNTGGWTTGTSGVGTIGGLLLPTGDGGQTATQVTYSGNVNVGLNVTGTQSYSADIGNVGTSLGIHVGNKDSGTGGDPFTAAGTLTLSGNNSYTGVTQVNRGTLSIGTVANAGSNSNIGAYASDGAAGLILNGGTFNYTGATTTTNRGFTVTGSVSTISVATAGEKLTLGNSIITGTTNQTLTVSGGAGSSLDITSLTYGSSNKTVTANVAVSIGTVTATTNNAFDSGGSQLVTVGDFVASTGTASVGGAGGLITGSITASNTFSKSGGGTWTYTGTSTTGNLTINGATGGFTVGGSGTLGTSASYAGIINHSAANTFTYNSSANQTLTGNHTGTGGILAVSGSGTLTLNGGTRSYTGATNITNGRLAVTGSTNLSGTSGITINGANAKFRYNSSTDLARPVTFTNGTLEGSNWKGTLSGLTIGTGQTISPGDSPGTATTDSQTWAGGGNYLWEINNASGTAGSDPGWDRLLGIGTLDITASSGSKFGLLVTSLTLANAAGAASNFNDALSDTWLIADFASITGFAAGAFNIDTTGFANPFTGNFGVSLGGVGAVPGDNSQIYLTYTAVPEPGAALLGGLGVLLLLRRKRS